MRKWTAAVAVALLVACSGCGTTKTIIPPQVVTTQASFDGNHQTSGILSVDETGFLVTPRYIERYDAMLEKYGERFSPPIKPGDRRGITPEGENYRITGETRSRFGQMNQMRKDGQ